MEGTWYMGTRRAYGADLVELWELQGIPELLPRRKLHVEVWGLGTKKRV